MASLKNLTLLITRPEQQAQSLGLSLHSLGAKVLFLPTIAISPIETPELNKQIARLKDCDLAIFISQNAVIHAMPLIKKYWPNWPARVKIASIGPGTAQALKKYNLNADYCPQNNFSTEGLLELPVFNKIKNQKIMLFKGQGGRELLANSLISRGAALQEAVVYRRELPQKNPQFLLPEQQIDIIICTSKEGLQNLVTIMEPRHRPTLLNMSLLVISEPMVALAKQLGFVKPALIADNATEAGIIAALVTWQEKLHGKSLS